MATWEASNSTKLTSSRCQASRSLRWWVWEWWMNLASLVRCLRTWDQWVQCSRDAQGSKETLCSAALVKWVKHSLIWVVSSALHRAAAAPKSSSTIYLQRTPRRKLTAISVLRSARREPRASNYPAATLSINPASSTGSRTMTHAPPAESNSIKTDLCLSNSNNNNSHSCNSLTSD